MSSETREQTSPGNSGQAPKPSRKKLALKTATLPELELRYQIAEEGYRLIQEAADKARAEANKQEQKARRVYDTLRERLEDAREAERRLKAVLPTELVARWEAAEDKVRDARQLRDDAKSAGRNVEYVEAALEQLEVDLRDARTDALTW